MRMKAKVLIFISLGSLILFTQNCGEFHSLQDENYQEGLLLSSPIDQNDSSQRVPYQMLTKKQIMSSVVTSTGITEPDKDLKALNVKYSPILSEKSDLAKYNPPRAMTYTNIAGEACRQLIAQERAEKNKRLIRHGIPVEAKDITAQEIDETIRSFARSFWSRNETTDELTIIKDSLKDYESTREVASLKEEAKAERQVLFLCTAMLSSLDAITY